MDKKNLLIIVPTLQLGGQERVAVNTEEIMSDIYNITFVVFDDRNSVYQPSCDVINLAIPSVSGKFTKVINVLRRASALRQLKRERHIDLTLSFGSTANLASILSGHIGKKFINLRGFGMISRSLLNDIMYRRSDAIICCSQKMCTTLSQINPTLGKKTFCIYNPYDMDLLQNMGMEMVTDYHFSPNTIVTHGRLDEVKNYPRLIKAFSLVQEKVLDAQLLLIGDGGFRPQLEKLIVSYNLENSVTLLGFRKNPFAYLSKSTLYVLSSYSEGFPNSLVEGMVFLPVVAVDCKTGPREILSDDSIDCVCEGYEEVDYGVLVQQAENIEFCDTLTDDDSILADAILSVLTKPDKKKNLQEKAKSRVQDFSYEVYHARLQQIFQEEEY